MVNSEILEKGLLGKINEKRRELRAERLKELIKDKSVEVKECNNFVDMMNIQHEFEDKYPNKFVTYLAHEEYDFHCVVVFEDKEMLEWLRSIL